ncbi:hypothetical protein LPJ61_003760 [Coemansia biformis]|uniref:Zf-UBP-domain-containing protein n=1 Tax=Coemansia biformis TaxID=1286918 RepID=A0A9W8CYB1_9FUNG|nr:hypothetical protein LPJ61_003760 [Coemansia biformis]
MVPGQPGPIGAFEASMACSSTYEVGVLRLYRSGVEHAEPELLLSPQSSGTDAPVAMSPTECTSVGRSGDGVGGVGSSSARASSSSDGRPTTLAVLAVPGYMAPTDFLSFTGPFADSIEHVRVIRDKLPNRYMLLLKLRSVAKADEFYAYYNGKTFSPLEPETCHVVYVSEVRCEVQEVGADDVDQEGAAIGTSPATLFLMPVSPTAESGEREAELPTCPVCLERLDSSVSGLLTTMCRHMFHCSCLVRWGDGSCPVCRYSQMSAFVDHERFQQAGPMPGLPFSGVAGEPGAAREGDAAEQSSCNVCGRTNDLWICLICGAIGCGRYADGHAKGHFEQTQHPYSMELVSQGVWDYAGDGYVHRLLHNMADRKVIAFESQSGGRQNRLRRAGATDRSESNPGNTGPIADMRHDDSSLESHGGNGGAKGGRGLWYASNGGPGSLVDAREKLQTVTQEYESLLASQLEAQRDHYEVQLARQNHQLAQQNTRCAEFERATDELQRKCAEHERQQSKHSDEQVEEAKKKLARADEDRKEWAAERRRLEASSSKWLKKSTDDARLLLEERAMSRQLADNYKAQQDQIADLKSTLADLEDQVRDLTFFISTQQALASGGGADSELHGASVVGVADPRPPRDAKGRRRIPRK